MKILAISDIHAKENQGLYDYLKNNNLDLIIVSGDITNFGPSEFAEDFLNKISSFSATVVAIPGNCDTEEVFEKINKSNAKCAHNNIVEYDNLLIYGFGGSNPTPFNTPFEFDDEVLYSNLEKLFKSKKAGGIEKKVGKEKNTVEKLNILLTHAPPYNSEADIIESGAHVGSEAVRKIIDEYQPAINFCGHVHESVTFSKIGNTAIVNPGMLENGSGCLVQIDENNNITSDMIVMK
ncbi:MAG: metallophosphoesterase [Methanobrevibacter sp.]|nr:metallophosphoesterase [Methanobrevibacter sp.]